MRFTIIFLNGLNVIREKISKTRNYTYITSIWKL